MSRLAPGGYKPADIVPMLNYLAEKAKPYYFEDTPPEMINQQAPGKLQGTVAPMHWPWAAVDAASMLPGLGLKGIGAAAFGVGKLPSKQAQMQALEAFKESIGLAKAMEAGTKVPVTLAKGPGEFASGAKQMLSEEEVTKLLDEVKSVLSKNPHKPGTADYYNFLASERTQPREVPFEIPGRGKIVGHNVAAAHGTVVAPEGKYGYQPGGAYRLSEDFNQFQLPTDELGVHFGSPRATSSFNFMRDPNAEGYHPRTFPVTLRANSPLEMRDLGSWGPGRVSDELVRLGFNAAEVNSARYKGRQYRYPGVERQIENLRNYIKEKGYDSIKYVNEHEDPGHTSYIMMDPSRIRVPWAKYDPTKLGSPDLLSGIAGGAVVGLGALESTRRNGDATEKR